VEKPHVRHEAADLCDGGTFPDWPRAPCGHGTFLPKAWFVLRLLQEETHLRERAMNGLIYLIGLIVVVLFILSLLGLR
jgi:hypothetical protein